MEGSMNTESVEVFGKYPRIYSYPWTSLTNITEDYIELSY